MSRISKVLLALAVLIAFGLATPTVKADNCLLAVGNLVANCGFETGTFTGWTQSGNTGFTSVPPGAANTGNFGASFGPVGTLGFISQNIVTLPGVTYNVTFHLRNLGSTPNEFRFLWGGNLITTILNAPPSPYTEFSFSVLATTVLTDLRFGFRQDPSFWNFADVVVTPGGAPIPEPTTMILLATGLVGAGIKARRRRNNKL